MITAEGTKEKVRYLLKAKSIHNLRLILLANGLRNVAGTVALGVENGM
jgi:hypothetical protein